MSLLRSDARERDAEEEKDYASNLRRSSSLDVEILVLVARPFPRAVFMYYLEQQNPDLPSDGVSIDNRPFRTYRSMSLNTRIKTEEEISASRCFLLRES